MCFEKKTQLVLGISFLLLLHTLKNEGEPNVDGKNEDIYRTG